MLLPTEPEEGRGTHINRQPLPSTVAEGRGTQIAGGGGGEGTAAILHSRTTSNYCYCTTQNNHTMTPSTVCDLPFAIWTAILKLTAPAAHSAQLLTWLPSTSDMFHTDEVNPSAHLHDLHLTRSLSWSSNARGSCSKSGGRLERKDSTDSLPLHNTHTEGGTGNTTTIPFTGRPSPPTRAQHGHKILGPHENGDPAPHNYIL